MTSQAWGQNDIFDIDFVGTYIQTRVNDAYEKVLISQVNQIVLAWNGGNDTFLLPFTLPAGIPIYHVQYVVSTNVDSADVGNPSDFIVDLDSVIPGAQIPLRAAIVEATNAFQNPNPPRAAWIAGFSHPRQYRPVVET